LTASMTKPPSSFTKAGSARRSLLTDIVKIMETIIPGLKYTFGYDGDMLKDHSIKKQHGKPPNYQPGKNESILPSKPTPDFEMHLLDDWPGNNRGRSCVKRCTKKQSGYYSLCGSCRKYIICYQGYVSLIVIGWLHMCITLTLIGWTRD